MSNAPILQSIAEWTAETVRTAIDASGRTKLEISEQAGIPYPTLNRKLAAHTEFSFRELLSLAEVLRVSPATFTPPPFRQSSETKPSAA